MIREMGNVELFGLCETIQKVQCTESLLFWTQGVIYCTCGHLSVESESSQHSNQWRLDALSIPHYVIKKGRPHGARHGKTEAQKEHFVAHNARKRCIKNGIHDRFQLDPVYRDSQLKIGWTEEKCIAMKKLAQKDHSPRLSYEEYERYQKHWYLTLNKSGKNAPMSLQSDFRTAVTFMNRLHRESGEDRPEPISFQQYQRWHPSSSSSSWRKWVENWWSVFSFVVAGSFTADGNLLQPTEWCKQYTSHVTFFSCTRGEVSHDIGSSVCARHPIQVSCA